jgi:hypothetical protein
MLVQLTTRKMIMDPCYHGRHAMIDFADDPRVIVKRNPEKSLDWHLKKANALLRVKKIKAKVTESRETRSILPPFDKGMMQVMEFEFELLAQVPTNVDSASGQPVDPIANEKYCFEIDWSAAAVRQMSHETPGHNNVMIEWYLRSTRYASFLDKKDFTRAKRALLRQLKMKSKESHIPEGMYWVSRP